MKNHDNERSRLQSLEVRAEALRRETLRRVLAKYPQKSPRPKQLPPAPILTEETEAQAARDLQEMEADRARQRANALAAFEEADALETRDHEIKTRQKDIHVAPATP